MTREVQESGFDVVVDDTTAMLAFGAVLAEAVRPEIDDGFVVDLRGELGAGKTVLVRGLARALGVPSRVRITSPTFVVARAYEIQDRHGGRATLQHVDAYRLEDSASMEAAGFEEMCGKAMLTCVEWGGEVAAALPADRLEIHLTLADAPHEHRDVSEVPQHPRVIRARAGGPRAARVARRVEALRS